MRKLYLRIYFAVLASLAAFAIGAGILWRTMGEPRAHEELAATIARNVLPPAQASAAEQRAALERLARDVRVDLGLFAADGTRLASIGEALPPPEGGGPRFGPRRQVWTTQLADGRWIVVRMKGPHRPGWGLTVLALILLAVGVGAYPVVRRLTQRLERLQRGVEALGAGNLAARVPVEGRDEVARLAESFNSAAARIESLVGAHRSLLASASHELRTPLTRIRMALELGKDRREFEQDIAELDALIDEILLASRLDALAELGAAEPVDLLALAAEEAARYGVEVQGDAVTADGDPRLLRRMIRNLLENARKHGAAPITVRLLRREQGVELFVCDSGPGVAAAERERVFEPFYSRARGSGLGLSIVRQIARRHGGEARCEGNCFVVRLKGR